MAYPMILSVSPLFSKQAIIPSFSQIITPGMNSLMAATTLSSQDTIIFWTTSGSYIPRKRGDRPSTESKFRGNQFMEMTASLDESSGTLPLPTPKGKRFQFTCPRRGYTYAAFYIKCVSRNELFSEIRSSKSLKLIPRKIPQ